LRYGFFAATKNTSNIPAPMSDLRLNEWRFSTRILLPLVAAGAATVLLVASVLLFATREGDRIARERQSLLVSDVLTDQVARISHDQESVTIWDDAVRKTSQTFDPEWIDINLGSWMFSYFGHDRVFVLNDRDEPVYAMSDGASTETSGYDAERKPVDLLAKQLRALLRSAAPEDAAAAPEKFRAADFVVIENRPAIASVLPIVSDSGEIVQIPGREYFHVAIRFLDRSFLDGMMQQYLLDGALFSWDNEAKSNEAAFPLVNKAGSRIGYFIWQPYRPGQLLLKRMAPALALALVLTALGVSLLVQRLRRSSTELQASEAQAQHLAFHDALTGLPNRALFIDRLDRSLIETRRDGARIALLYLDLDRFKNVNDTLGHPAGDDLIRELGDRLTGLTRGKDCVARLGGDEFAILQCGVTSPEDVVALCERVIQAVSHPFELLGNSAFVGVSIGVAVAPDSGVDRAELMRKADIALYRAKFEGRNRFRIFSEEMDFFVQRRRRIEVELRDALASGDQLKLVYQPLYATNSGAMCGIEALLRWSHPKHGAVSPGVFIPIAEESGLIHPIGDWVLREACLAGKRWPVRRVAVNVSAVQFRSPLFASKVLDTLRETGLEPSRLELEITESVLLDLAEIVEPTFNTLRSAGVRIALDDFGTGYSSLTYLQKFPVDKIKIDRSFVHNLDADAASDAIVQAIVDLARAMGVEVTAEGVETEAQRDALKRIGCDELQGFLLSSPLSVEDMDALLGSPVTTELPRVATAA
jgi:diguanylate cyclase (GGDEF)-like protein